MVLAGGTQGLCLEDDLEVAQNGGRGHSAQRQQWVQGEKGLVGLVKYRNSVFGAHREGGVRRKESG